MRADPARQAALDLLEAVRIDDAYANVVWPSIIARWEIEGRDAAFATDLAYGTLRWRGLYDCIITECADRKLDQIDSLIAQILRLGAHQLLRMRVPAHAAVDSSCELARARGIEDSGRVGFINAVLRKVARHDFAQWQERCAQTSDPRRADARIAVTTSHPEWIVAAIRTALTAHLGRPASDAELTEALEANNAPARVTLALRGDPTRQQDSDSEFSIEGTDAGRWLPTARTLPSGVPGQSAAVREGRAIVQDEGSQLAVRALLAASVDPPESAWLDMCAGPGGKAALLADAAATSNVELLAVEIHEHRAGLVERTVAPAAITIEVGDATTRPWGNRFFDRILLDAPCTGLGALRRRPEARWRRSDSDLAALTSLQRRLLDIGLASLRRGGVLAYVTCSPHVAETRDALDGALMAHEEIVELDARELLPDIPDLGPGPHVQLWPHLHGTDAMFIALLRRG